jgi:hypothetical protein
MNSEPAGRRRRRLRGIARYAVRRSLVTALLVAGAGVALLLAGGSTLGPDVATIARTLLVMLLPALLLGAVAHGTRSVRARRRIADDRRAASHPQPTSRPIERIAADLRRLLWQHDTCSRLTDVSQRARRLWFLQIGISDCAVEAARALEVPLPDRAPDAAFAEPQLRRLLRALAAEGLVLPAVDLLLPDNRW